MRVSKRLYAIEKMIPFGCVLADIGCDHAYLDVLAVQNKKTVKCYACEVAEGPLERACQTITAMHCENSIFPLLSNGFDNVPCDANVCVIAGMGFETMKIILNSQHLQQFHTLILQANSDVDQLRIWLIQHGWQIVAEDMVHEGHYYTILKAQRGYDTYSDEDYIFGKFLNNDVFRDYWTYRRKTLIEIISRLKDNKRVDEMQHLVHLIDRRLYKSKNEK